MTISFFGIAVTPDDGDAPGTTTTVAVTPPASMAAGDLVLLHGQGRGAGTLSISEAGGQSWSTIASITTSGFISIVSWCVFDGTWDADPEVSSSGSANAMSVSLRAWRSDVSGTWSLIDDDDGSAGAPSSPFDCVVPGVTPSGFPNVSVALLWSADDNQWGSSSPGSWTFPGGGSINQYRNLSGSDISQTAAYQIQNGSAAATGDFTAQQTTLGGDIYRWCRATFLHTADAGVDGTVVPGAATAAVAPMAATLGVIPGPITVEVERAVPTATTENEGTPAWVGDPDNTDLHLNVDESPASDTDFVWLDNGTGLGGSFLQFALGTLSDPGVHTGHVVRLRAVEADAGVPGAVAVQPEYQVYLNQGATLIAFWESESFTAPALTGSWQDIELQVTEAEAAEITDYGDLLVTIGGFTGSVSDECGIAVSAVAFELLEVEQADTPVLVPVAASGSVAPLIATLGAAGTNGTLVPVAASASVAPLIATLGTMAGAMAPVAAEATVNPVAGSLGTIAGEIVASAADASAVPLAGTVGAVAGALVPVAATGSTTPLDATIGIIAADLVPCGAEANVAPLAGFRPDPDSATLVSVAADASVVQMVGTLGAVDATTVPVASTATAVPLTATLGSIDASLAPVAADADVVPIAATQDAGIVAGTLVPVGASATVAPMVATLGPISATLVPNAATVAAVPLAGTLAPITATIVSVAADAVVVPIVRLVPIEGALVPCATSAVVVPMGAFVGTPDSTDYDVTRLSGPRYAIWRTSGPRLDAARLSGPRYGITREPT